MKLEIMNPDNNREKTDYIRKATEKKMYFSPVLECIKLDNEISLVLSTNTFNELPGDPFTPDCINEVVPENGFENPFE